MRHALMTGLVAIATAGCAVTPNVPPQREAYSIDIAFERPDGTRVAAPTVTAFTDQRIAVSVAAPSTYSYIEYIEDYDVELATPCFVGDPISKTAHEGVWIDLTAARASPDQVELRYQLRRSALKRPGTTVAVHDELVGTCRLSLGEQRQLVPLPAHEGVEPLVVFARVRPAAVDAQGAIVGEEIDLDPR